VGKECGGLSGSRRRRDGLEVNTALLAVAERRESIGVAAAAAPHELFATTRHRVVEIGRDVRSTGSRVARQVTQLTVVDRSTVCSNSLASVVTQFSSVRTDQPALTETVQQRRLAM